MISVRLIPFVWLFACLVAAGLDPYEVLGVARDADEKTIKSQYRQLLKQYHPDKNPDPEAHDRFIEVGEAYGILNDPKKRENYDKFGDPEGQPQHNGMSDMFGQFFHGHPGFSGQQGRQRGLDTQVQIELTLQEFYVGKDLDFSVEMQNICESCDGSGSADGKRHKCLKCSGLGVQIITRQFGPMIQQFQLPCDKCQGSGETIANRCKSCDGQGTAKKHRHYSVFVDPGTPRNYKHELEGEGHQSPDWVPGNLNILFTENPRENWGFRRVGDNLYRTEVLTAQEAAHGGWLRQIHMFDDEIVTLKREKGRAVMQGHVDIVAGHGMPRASDHEEHGDLFIDYKVIPVGTSSREKDEL